MAKRRDSCRSRQQLPVFPLFHQKSLKFPGNWNAPRFMGSDAQKVFFPSILSNVYMFSFGLSYSPSDSN